ncbi:MAG TPA: hypothetical protein PKW42_01065, partial [bacterium]|nr:hypothetical protein [bacterium]
MTYQRLSPEQVKSDPERQLRDFKRHHEFLVAVDSDGCVVDNMNGKQILIFHPLYIEFYNLWPIETYVREIFEYYSLFSIHRGCNRFLAVQSTVRDLHARQDVRTIVEKEKIILPAREPVDAYIKYATENKQGLGNPGLEKFLTSRGMDWPVHKLLGWSEAVNRSFPFLEIPPFENVRQALSYMA